jgi:hypothetical protein
MPDDRREHLVRFYALLDDLERRIGGQRALGDCSGRMDWPRRGVYFFREAGELRSDTGHGPRIVRVGTHALTSGSSTKLWTRLSQHLGKSNTGGGNHRGSIFRLIVGTALMARDDVTVATWGRQRGDARHCDRRRFIRACRERRHSEDAVPVACCGRRAGSGKPARHDRAQRDRAPE